jgi:zinc transport system substrate-binding protein
MLFNSTRRLAVLLLAGAALTPLAATASRAQSAPKVVVTMKPVHALVHQVMAGVAEPDLIVQGNSSPHTYALKPSDARRMNEAHVLFRVSGTIESFTDRAIRSLSKSVRVVTLEDAPGLSQLPKRQDANFETSDGSQGHKGHNHGHSHGHGGKSKGQVTDGHVWLDPANAKVMVTQIAKVLGERYPQHAAAFSANVSKAHARLDTLAADLERDLKPLAGKPYLVFHDAYQYLERRFGLTPVGSVVIDPETPPSGKRLTELRGKITKLGPACAFSEPNFEARVIASVVEGTSARAGTLDPEATMVPPGPDAYDQLMRGLASGLKTCLAPAS